MAAGPPSPHLALVVDDNGDRDQLATAFLAKQPDSISIDVKI
jgi:hypothetical protein